MNWLCISNSIFVIMLRQKKKKKSLPTYPHVQTLGRQWQTNNFLSLAFKVTVHPSDWMFYYKTNKSIGTSCIGISCIDTLCVDTSCIGTLCIGTLCIGTLCIDTSCIGQYWLPVDFTVSLQNHVYSFSLE